MTPPTEKPFEPTPEQVEEVAIRMYSLAQGFEMWEARELFPTLFPSSRDAYKRQAQWHLANLSTLRSQVEAANYELLLKSCRCVDDSLKIHDLTAERDALKAQVVVSKVALSYILNHPIDNEALCVFEMQHTAKQALTQLEAK